MMRPFKVMRSQIKPKAILGICFLGVLVGCLARPLQAQPSYMGDTAGDAFKGAVKKLVKAGDAAFRREQYIVSTDRYNRALLKETDSLKAIRIYYKLAKTRHKLNHPEAAYNSFKYLWDKGERGRDFLRDYIYNLFMVSHYDEADSVIDTMAYYRMPVLRWREMLALGRASNDSGAPVYPKTDLTLDSVRNSPFSDYGGVLLRDNDEYIFSSTRPLEGETVMDPRTGHS
ncbi:MAG: hypothetical protein K2H70_03190, partial [Bacteroidales bacterium]|nr:hypothetical protein [Bacteroidales bacterium]